MTEDIKVKICGQTSLEDAELCVRMGADFIGVVFNIPSSLRSQTLEQALPIFDRFRDRAFLLCLQPPLETIMEAVMELDPYAIQLTGQETPDDVARLKDEAGGLVFKSLHIPPAGSGEALPVDLILERMNGFVQAGVDGFVLDTAAGGLFGGTGVQSDWTLAAQVIASSPAPTFIAGGINPLNVAQAAALPNVYGIDLASGVEEPKGIKNAEKLEALFTALGRR